MGLPKKNLSDGMGVGESFALLSSVTIAYTNYGYL
jgi:hypothetical protein